MIWNDENLLELLGRKSTLLYMIVAVVLAATIAALSDGYLGLALNDAEATVFRCHANHDWLDRKRYLLT